MLKPSFRFFIIPLGAVATLATLSAQNIQPRAQRDTGSMFVREQVVDCGTKSPTEVCVISYDSETPADQFLAYQVLTSQVTSNDPAGMPPSRVALRLAPDFVSVGPRKSLTET